MNRPIATLFRILPALLLGTAVLVTPLLAESYLKKRVRVSLKDGGTISGLVVEELPDGSLNLKLGRGSTRVAGDQISGVVVLKPASDEYADREGKAKSADDWYKLARWCGLGDINLPEKRLESLEKAIQVDPDHAGARKALGHVKVLEKWYGEEEGNRLLGKTKVDGKWVSAAEAKRLKRDKKLKGSKRVSGLAEAEKEREGRPWAEVDTIETEHYVVKCNSTKTVASRYADIMEALFEAYSELFPEDDFPRHSLDKGPIYIFRNIHEYRNFTFVDRGVGGFYDHLERAVRTYHGSFGLTGSTDEVLAHEALHQFQGLIIQNMHSGPFWLIEGMATYFGDGSDIKRNKVTPHQIPRDRLQNLQSVISSNTYLPLRKLIRLDGASFGGIHYAHAWGFIYWCLQGKKHKAHKGEGRRIWDTYLQHVCNRLPERTSITSMSKHLDSEARVIEQLILKETGYQSIEEWEESYKEFILGLKLVPLGTWKGKIWRGSRDIGIELRFPSKLKSVPGAKLRPGEAAAAAASPGKKNEVRMALFVSANWNDIENTTEEALYASMQAYFRVREIVEEPKVRVIDDVLKVAVASFKGLPRRRDGHAGHLGMGDAKEEGDDSSGKKSGRKGKSKSKKSRSSGILDYRMALVTTADKIYVIALSGPTAPFSKIEPQFDKTIESIKLSF